tara:strand:- start:21519 stop:21689 length:171 start_codon:yes stop_codon:yes gene_type:complete
LIDTTAKRPICATAMMRGAWAKDTLKGAEKMISGEDAIPDPTIKDSDDHKAKPENS